MDKLCETIRAGNPKIVGFAEKFAQAIDLLRDRRQILEDASGVVFLK